MPYALAPRVAAVTVTYGDRWSYLSRVLQRLREEASVARVVVVDNASRVSIAQHVAEAGYGDFVHVITAAKNQGSARAYSQGLAHVRTLPDITHAYLLDDDNLPEPGAVDALMRAAADADRSTAFVSLRPSRSEHHALVKQGVPVTMRQDSFLGFSLRATLRHRLRGDRRGPGESAGSAVEGAPLEVEYAPYGGFFFAVDQLDVVGLPREEFFLYVDDHEFTHRFVSEGGSIRLCAESLVNDLEPSWHDRSNRPVPPLFDPENPEFRVYYSVRNRVMFERERLVHSQTEYWTNVAVSLLHSCALAGRHGVPLASIARRASVIGSAIKNGWRGHLGHNPRIPIPGA